MYRGNVLGMFRWYVPGTYRGYVPSMFCWYVPGSYHRTFPECSQYIQSECILRLNDGYILSTFRWYIPGTFAEWSQYTTRVSVAAARCSTTDVPIRFLYVLGCTHIRNVVVRQLEDNRHILLKYNFIIPRPEYLDTYDYFYKQLQFLVSTGLGYPFSAVGNSSFSEKSVIKQRQRPNIQWKAIQPLPIYSNKPPSVNEDITQPPWNKHILGPAVDK